MTKEEYWDNKKNLLLKEARSYRAFELGVDFSKHRIEQLEKENAELERKLEQTEKDLADYQFNYPTIKELQKENVELKKKLNVFSNESANACFAHNEKSKQLTKAKNLIELLLSDNRTMKAQFESEEQANIWFKHIHQAEQFLSEVEK